MYSDKLAELRTEGEPIKQRRLEFELRPGALDDYSLAIQLAKKAVDAYKYVCLIFTALVLQEEEHLQIYSWFFMCVLSYS